MKWSNDLKIPKSKYPKDFIPKGATTVIGVDNGSPDGDCTVRGFFKDGVFHVQEVDYDNEPDPLDQLDDTGRLVFFGND